jgi:signal transduction histidine kinase
LLNILPFRFFGEGDNFSFVISMMGNIVCGLTLGIIGWITYRLVDLQRSQQKELETANRKLRKYAFATERLAQSQERNRIAREMHDTLAHTLSGVAVQLEAIKALFSKKPQQAKQVLEKTLENTRHGLDETRRALVDMRSSAIETYGLKQAIENLVISAAERGGFQSKVSLPASDELLDDEINHCIYRSVQEALENSIKHSNAKSIAVTLENQPDNFTLIIEDDGKGFDPEKIRKEQMGIHGMRERVELLGGTLTIDSKPNMETKIIIQLPRSDD